MPRLDNLALVSGRAAPVVREVLRERPPVEEIRAEEIDDFACPFEKALVAGCLEESEARLEQVHVGILETESARGPFVEESHPDSGTHVSFDEVECLVRSLSSVRIARRFEAPSQGEQHEREVVEVGRRIEHRPGRREPPRPALLGAEPCVSSEVLVRRASRVRHRRASRESTRGRTRRSAGTQPSCA